MADDDLRARIGTWLGEQGYPLEFATAACFSKAGFGVMQGYHIESDAEAPREIDVVAEINVRADEALARVEFVVECKWSGDKPWVVFAGNRGIAPSACVAQTLGSRCGRAVLWARAGDPTLHKLGIFSTPDVPGFGGRQAFSSGRDVFYDALRSVASLSYARAVGYDDHVRSPMEHLDLASVVIPVVVVRGRLFTARFNEVTGNLLLEETGSTRLHWRGSDKWHLHTTIDVVTEGELPRFVAARAKEALELGRVMSRSILELRRCARDGKLDEWEVTDGARGFRGTPRLLKELSESMPPGVSK